MFRLEAVLTEPVVVEILQQAVACALERFSLLHVEVKSGLFWNFLQNHVHPPIIESIDNEPCRLYSYRLYRILAGGRRLAFEVSHLLADGVGACEIFRTLLCTYYDKWYNAFFEKRRHWDEEEDWSSVISPYSQERPEEYEDAYLKYYKKGMRQPARLGKAFHFPEKRGHRYRLTRVYCTAKQLTHVAAAMSIGLSTFLCALSLYTCACCYPPAIRARHPLRSLYLINLRNFFYSATLRNFFLYVFPSIDYSLKEFSLEQIAHKIHEQLHVLLSREELQRYVSSYVHAEKNIFARMTPRFIKNLALKIPQYFEGERQFTLSCSNLGKIVLPSAVMSLVQDIAFFPPPSRVQGRSFCAVGYGSTVCLTTGRYIETDIYERTLVKILSGLGVSCTYYDW